MYLSRIRDTYVFIYLAQFLHAEPFAVLRIEYHEAVHGCVIKIITILFMDYIFEVSWLSIISKCFLEKFIHLPHCHIYV